MDAQKAIKSCVQINRALYDKCFVSIENLATITMRIKAMMPVIKGDKIHEKTICFNSIQFI